MTELSLHILDIVQNSIRAEANTIEITINEQISEDRYTIIITDNGSGMDEETLKNAIDPFFTTRTTRKVGIGLSLFKQNAELSGGTMTVESKLGQGTKVSALFGFSHIDRLPLGDMAGTMTLLIGANPKIRFIYNHITQLSDFEFDTNEVLEELGKVPINHPDILKALKEMIEENLDMIEAAK
ncbi:MAG TPA: ATP-binding protein [Prolixibacteraceae bacterium]|nr:ATP-binding protein [Bacteroidales bacterium]HPB05634.1 ATP-binding protein [Prolixibacteraceae bacterium]HQN93144.1 ATP-binding protein [Prolixibacteraceae bacterium]